MAIPLRGLAALVAAAIVAASCTSAPGDIGGGLGPACGKGDPSWRGVYTMQGVPEVGSQFVLKPDGSFEFYLAYGANDQYGKGCWTQTDRVVALIPAGQRTIAPDHTPDTRGFTGILLLKDGRDLLWRIAGSHYTGRYRK